jgi:formylglycine-generating enzyme required for sulfatase activity
MAAIFVFPLVACSATFSADHHAGGNTSTDSGAAGAQAGHGGSATGETGGVAGAHTGGTTGSGGAATGGMAGTGGNPTAGCPTGLPGPTLVEVPTVDASAVASYCIDATEVTRAQYTTFLAANHPTTGQDSWCSWNTTYAPTDGAPGTDERPVVNVDWCDAAAYCKWAGQRLCGKVGGGSSGFYDNAKANLSEWYNACSAGGAVTYPYGNAFDVHACVENGYDNLNDYQAATDYAHPVGTSTCEGGFKGLFDMVGNVAEWEDACDGLNGTTDICLLRGGTFQDANLSCTYGGNAFRNYTAGNVGFRCCATRP